MDFLKAEFHCHVKLLAGGKFRRPQLIRRLNAAKGLGLDVLAVTEHMDAHDFWDIVECLIKLGLNGSGNLCWKGMRLLTGAEVTIAEGGDILLIGSAQGLKQLESRLGRLDGNNLPPFKDLLDASEDLGFLRIGAHPCRAKKVLWKMGPLLKRLDALEINAGELSKAGYVHHQAREAGVAVVAGSDAHHWLQLGRLYNIIPAGNGPDFEKIKRAVREKKTTWCRGGALHRRILNCCRFN
ncbi:hypothetical protein DCCM_3869 [Desulfocucumis palustris]|uniref:Polymerase/histidinol phosphatase N-terminal domain-containing protein n=1 Tax=Desulfocucumis palustris TaxID=1898651 RepID=A0A2L2XEF6_9FIRM|nr:PHP-associated domain-containing protein [Desulfocucumis palustris]GBF34749.1 hypothetical protein DCCM_3869 [Desulfocucumis palustris]